MQGKNLSDNFNYPLLSMQEAFVSHIIRKKDSQEYLIKIIFEISPCDPQKVFEAWQQIHDIYEVFKLKFNIHDNGELSQAFTSKNPHQVKFLDATKYSEERLKNLTDNLLSDFAINNNGKQITNFSQSIIVKISNDKSLLVWVLHHVLIDGWSMMRLLKKFKECYSNENLQYKPDNSLSTYLTWKQHNHYKSRSYDFWKTELSVFEAPSYLNERDFDKNEEEPCNYLFEINGILLENIKASARRLHTTINIILQSAWIILLQNISGKDTVAYGVVVNGRDYNYEECNEVVGCKN
jgi:nonribosomal peptide synthetase CepC